jgi:adenine-specific DNA methylase
MDAVKLLKDHKPKVDIIYIDPPYGGQQSDYYEMYGFFEDYLGIPRPEAADRFVKSKSYRENFEELLSSLPVEPIWIFSYNDDSWASIDEIRACIEKYKKDEIIVKEIKYKYKYSGKENESGTEYVIVAH